MSSKRKTKELAVWCVFGVLVLLAWMVLSVPTIIFSLSVNDSSEEMEADVCDQLSVSESCDHQIYSGVCTQHLLRYQMCHSNGSTANRSQEGCVVYIPSGQANLEGTARDALLNLTLLDPSPTCKMELARFICLHLFGVCTDSGEVVRPSSGQCERLRTEVCASEWERAERYEQDSGGGLFDNVSLSGLCEVPLSVVNQTTCANTSNQSDECSPDFYLSEEGQCEPQCGEWKQYSKTASEVLNTLAVLGGCVYIVGGVAALVVSCTQYKNMYKFPGILLMYHLITLGLQEVLLLISYTDQKGLYCSHQSFVDTLTDPTVFCQIIGAVTLFSGQQIISLLFFHTLVVLWGMMFPFHARRTLDNSRKRRYIHITIVLLSTVLPTMTAIGSFVFGNYITAFPPVSCPLDDIYASYFLFILPACVMAMVTVSCLILVIWLLATRKHKHVKAVKRILILLVHFMLITLAFIVTYSFVVYEEDRFYEELMDYFKCERTAGGNQSCSRSEFEQANISLYSIAITWILISAYPWVLLMYMAGDARELGKACLQLPRKLKRVRTECCSLSLPNWLHNVRSHTSGKTEQEGGSQVSGGQKESEVKEEGNEKRHQQCTNDWNNECVRVDERDDQDVRVDERDDQDVRMDDQDVRVDVWDDQDVRVDERDDQDSSVIQGE